MKQHASESGGDPPDLRLVTPISARPSPPPPSLIFDHGLSPNAVRLYTAMQYWAAQGMPFPARHKMAEAIGVTTKTIATVLNELEPTYLRRSRSYDGGPNNYALVALNEAGEPDTTRPPLIITPLPKVPSGVGRYGFSFWNLFWPAYPRKVQDAAALQAYLQLRPDEALLAIMLQAISDQHLAEMYADPARKKFVPYASNWLTKGQWNDPPDEWAWTKQQPGTGFGETLDTDYYKRYAAERRADSAPPRSDAHP